MREKLRLLMRNTRLRYIISYMLITVLLITAIGIYMYSYYSRSILESTLSGEKAIMYQVKYLCDGYMSLMESSALRLSDLDESELASAAEVIRITGDSREIICISDSETANSLAFEDSVPIEPGILASQYVTSENGTHEYVTFIYPVSSGRELMFLLPSESLRLETEGEDISLRSRYIIFDGEVIASSSGFSMDEGSITRANALDEEYTETKRVSGRDYTFTRIQGSRDGVYYVSALTLDGIRSNAAGVWLGFAAFMLVLAIPCLGFMFYISRRNLQPILELGRRFGSTDGNEIASIDEGIKGLEGENAALTSIVTDSLPARRHMFVKQLVRGLISSREEAVTTGSKLGIDTSPAYFCVILTGRPDMKASAEELASSAPEGVSAAGTDMLEHNNLMVLAFSDDAAKLEAYAESLASSGQYSPVAVSNIHENTDAPSGAYLEASAAYESRFIMGTSRLLRFSNIPVTGKGRTDTVKYINRIRDALSSADTQALDICLNELTLYLKGGDMTLFAFRRFYNDIISAVAAEAGDAFSPEMYDLFSLSECSSIDELDSILRSVCSRVISARVKSGQASPVQALVKMLTESYTDSEFSLSAAADSLGLTNARMSTEFKSALGMTPADYLTMLRMEQAKKLLVETELPVRDIAAGSGYSDASSFTRRFRIYTGNTPLQYRQAAKNDELLDT